MCANQGQSAGIQLMIESLVLVIYHFLAPHGAVCVKTFLFLFSFVVVVAEFTIQVYAMRTTGSVLNDFHIAHISHESRTASPAVEPNIEFL